METNALQRQETYSDAAASDSTIRTAQFNVECTGQRLFDTAYTRGTQSSPAEVFTNGRQQRDQNDPYAALFKDQSQDQPKEQPKSTDQAREVRTASDTTTSFGANNNEPEAISKYLNRYPKAPQDRVKPETDDVPQPAPVNPEPQPIRPDNPNPNPNPRPRPDVPQPNPDNPPTPAPPPRLDPDAIDDKPRPSPPPRPVQPDVPTPNPNPNPRPRPDNPQPRPQPCPRPG